MTAATNPQTVTFGTGPFTFTVPPQWRWLQVDNQTTASVTVTVQNGSATTIHAFSVATLTSFASGMGTALNNPNLDANNHGLYYDGSPGGVNESGYPQDQSEALNWDVQNVTQTGALAGQVVVTGTAASGNVYLSWL